MMTVFLGVQEEVARGSGRHGSEHPQSLFCLHRDVSIPVDTVGRVSGKTWALTSTLDS